MSEQPPQQAAEPEHSASTPLAGVAATSCRPMSRRRRSASCMPAG